jgi:hypothetical protein
LSTPSAKPRPVGASDRAGPTRAGGVVGVEGNSPPPPWLSGALPATRPTGVDAGAPIEAPETSLAEGTLAIRRVNLLG